MTDNIEYLILEHLKALRAEQAAMRADLRAIKTQQQAAAPDPRVDFFACAGLWAGRDGLSQDSLRLKAWPPRTS